VADNEVLEILKQGPETWNSWRKAGNIDAVSPDLTGADLRQAHLNNSVTNNSVTGYPTPDLRFRLRCPLPGPLSRGPRPRPAPGYLTSIP
jgi:hypothetical protein